MGLVSAEGMIETGADLRTVMTWHLRSNHYPPVPHAMVDICIEAIERANDGEWDDRLELPEGTTYKGSATAPVHAIVEAHHLDVWIEQGEG